MTKKRWGARIGLLAAYLGIGFFVIWFFGAGGHGTFLPMPILYSGGLIPLILFGRLLGHPVSPILPLISLLAYLAFLIYLNTIFAKVAVSRVPWVTLSIHGLGAILGLIIIPATEYRRSDSAWDIAGIVVSAVLVLAYLESDWLLAGGRIQPAPKGPYWDLGKP
jgi:hypothetical protein